MPSSPAFRQTASLTAGLSTVCWRGYAIRRESVSFPRKVWRRQAAAFKKTVGGLEHGHADIPPAEDSFSQPLRSSARRTLTRRDTR
jgi:hypothetical protein